MNFLCFTDIFYIVLSYHNVFLFIHNRCICFVLGRLWQESYALMCVNTMTRIHGHPRS